MMTDTITRRDPNTGQRQQWMTEGNTGYWLDIPGDTAPTTRPTEVAPMPIVQEQAGAPNRTVRTVTHITPDATAKAFVIRTRPLSYAAGGAMAFIWLMARWAIPFATGSATAGLAIVAIVAIFAGLVAYLVVWSGAYILDMATSPGGLGLFESWRTQRRLDRQSDAMVKAFKRHHGIEEQ